MKQIHKVNFLLKIFFILFFLFFLILGNLFFIENNEATVFEKLVGLLSTLFFISSIYALFKLKIIVDDEKIEIPICDILPFFKGKRVRYTILSLNWDEIGDLRTKYVLYPEMPIIVLKPKHGVNKKPLEFMMFGMSIELLKDILSHLLLDTKVYLYPYLKRKLEGKQTWFYNAPDVVTTAKEIVERNKIREQQRSQGEIAKTKKVNIFKSIITCEFFKEVLGVITILVAGILIGIVVIFTIYILALNIKPVLNFFTKLSEFREYWR